MILSQEAEIDLDLIDLGERLREVDQGAAETLAHSMRERGLITPIELRPGKDGRYLLTAGAHRYVAAQMLAWPSIRALIFSCSDEEARLREIDENLYRQELTPFDQANFLEERRRLWEKLHGQVKRGGDRRSKAQNALLIEEMQRGTAFLKETSIKFAIPLTTLKRALTRKAQIAPKVWAALQGTEAARNGALLDKIRKLAIEEQVTVAETVRARGCTVPQAIKIVCARPEVDADIRDFDALRLAWKRASPDVRKRFLALPEVAK